MRQPPKIKICGLFNPADVDYVNEALPDYVGFVFAESRRRVSFETAREFKKRLNPRIAAVGVFVNAEISDAARLYGEGTIDAAQLHGDEDYEYIERLKTACPVTVIKAVRAGRTCPENADYAMFDSGGGGTGRTFDWGLLPKRGGAFFLAGGINIGNIRDAAKMNPYCVDISSGAEENGVKSREKILELVKAARAL
ncbi:MAG: phosphoribosylanthranilate isomerase [Oscillospiraceae bacterium]|jgi:phosphoribosylanthranilate isomerase|nr:phosphoribosylanthranilate isomerase [Oscillospiraceae bacterium]